MRGANIFIFVFVFCCPVKYNCETVQTPIVSIELKKGGFHRDLIYTVQFNSPLAGKECEYVLEQTLPAAVYIDVDELNNLKFLKKLNAIYPDFVNVELTAEKAEPFAVLLQGMPKTLESLRLPIHFRYHTPVDESTFAIIDIATPKMYIKCPKSDNELLVNELEIIPNTPTYCLEEHAKSITWRPYYSDGAGSQQPNECNWKLLQPNFQLKSVLRAKIPVGNKKSIPFVLFITVIISWALSIWTVYRTNYVPTRINQKLEEQRVLQNKMK